MSLFVLSMRAILGLQCSLAADAPLKLVSVSTNTASLITTNSSEINPQTGIGKTNQVLLSTNASTSSSSAATNPPSGDSLTSTEITVVIQERSEAGPFSEQSGKGSFGFANIEAGFGQVYENDSIVTRGRNGTAWEETRYFFFKKVVKF